MRQKKEKDQHYRPPFALDRDRILYSGAFRRYTGKTQVIYFASMLDEQLTSRSLHTISVAQISKTIGRMLSLNTDLIEAIALGHDLGHPPFGHDGEVFLSEVSSKFGLGQFHHNIQSLRVVDRIAKHGNGLNLSFQTRDGILSHNGEVHDQGLSPNPTKTEQDLDEYVRQMESGHYVDMLPMTLEGCVVRLSDTIAYIGQDIEDAIRIGLLKREEIPSESAEILGISNGQIIETLVSDVVQVSYSKDFISFSDKISQALYRLKKFNYERIYKSPRLKVNHSRIKRGFEILFEHYFQDLKNDNKDSTLFSHFLNAKSNIYLNQTQDEIKIRDYIASMTDRYFTIMLEKLIVPQVFSLQIESA
jgi:dGTPase